jgi:hypothetical protein
MIIKTNFCSLYCKCFNTWEKKTITFEGDTTGALDNDNAQSLNLQFWLGAGTTYTSGTLNTTWGASVNANRAVGQVNIADSTSNDWYITGIQLEAGTTASDFEFLPVDVNLDRCLDIINFLRKEIIKHLVMRCITIQLKFTQVNKLLKL